MTRNGTHVVTAGVLAWAGDNNARRLWLLDCLERHHRRKWGDVDVQDWAANDRAVACQAGRVLSAYQAPTELDTPDSQLWIITDDLDDADTITTILLAREY